MSLNKIGLIFCCFVAQLYALNHDIDYVDDNSSIDQDKMESILERLFLNRDLTPNELNNYGRQNDFYGIKKNEKSCYEIMSVDSNKIIHSKQSILNGASFIDVKYIKKSQDTDLILNELCMDYCCQYDSCDTTILSLRPSEKGYRCYLFSCSDKCLFVKHDYYDTMQMNYLANNSTKTSQTSSTTTTTTKSSYLPKENCHNLQFTCKTSKTCIPIYDVCNSFNDCPDGSDELNCPTIRPITSLNESPLSLEFTTKKPAIEHEPTENYFNHEKQQKLKPYHFFKNDLKPFKIDDIIKDYDILESKEVEFNGLNRFHDNYPINYETTAPLTSKSTTERSTISQDLTTNNNKFNLESIKHDLFINTSIAIILLVVGVSLTLGICIYWVVNANSSNKRVKLPGFKRLRNNSDDVEADEDYLINGMYL